MKAEVAPSVVYRFLRAPIIAGKGSIAVLAMAGAVAYFLAARLGLALLIARSDVAVFWPASGIAAGMLMVLGSRAAPGLVLGVVLGTIAAGFTSDRSLLTSLFNGIWNAGEAVLAAWLLERWFGLPFTFGDLHRVAGFVVAAGFATAAFALGGAATLTLFHADTTAPYWVTWREWFLSSCVGMVVVAPLVIGAAQIWRKPPPREEWIEGVGVLCLVAMACSYTLRQATGSWVSFSQGAFVLPLLLWLTARCSPTFGIAGAFVASTGIILATTFGIGRFGDAAAPIMQRVTGAQLTMMTITLFTLVLAVLFAQRKAAEDRLAKERAMLARLHEVGTRLWLKRDLRQVLDAILAGAIELLGGDMGAIRILDTARGVLKIEAQRGLKQEFLDFFREVSAADDSACGRVLQSGKRIVIEDVEADTLYTPFRLVARAAGYRAVQSTPIASREGAMVGTLAIHFRAAHRPNEQDLRLLDLYVKQAADIIEHHRAEDALRESEERLRLAQSKTGVGIWDRDLCADKVTWTPELAAIYGVEPGYMKCYADFRDRVHPDDIEVLRANQEAAVQRGETFRNEFRIIHPDGKVRWLLSMGGAVYDAAGKPNRILGNNVDITERKEAEIALAERNTQLELASKTARVGTFVMEFHKGIVKLSPGCASIFGLPESTTEISREYALKLVHPEDLPRLELRRDQAFLKQQREFVAQYRIRRVDDGEVRWMEVRSLNFYDRDGQPSRAIAIIIDFTERKLAEEMLAERNLQLEVAGKIGLVGSYVYDSQTERIQISPGYAAIYDLPNGTTEIPFGEWLAHVHPEDVATLQALRSETFRERRGEYKVDFRIIRRDSETRWIESRGSILYGIDVGTRRVIGVNIDVTERKRTDLALAEREAQLALAANAARIGCYANDLQTGVITVSDGYAAIHGLPKGTVHTTIGQWRTRVHPDDLAPFDELRERIFGNRQRDFTYDYRIIHADQRVRWIESRGSVSYDERGQPQHCVGINIDVTERKQTEARLSDALAAGHVVGFEWDAATGRSQRSDNGVSILGVVEDGHFLEQVHRDDRAGLKRHIRALSVESPSYALAFRFARADGAQVWLEETAKAEFDGTGRLLRIKGLTRDITERKELEDHKNSLISELDHRVKNVLALVSTVASRTQETSSSMAEFVAALDGRIKSMATTHELLSHRRWQGIPLAELVRHELAPYATASNTRIDGPDVVLSAEAGQTLAMVFHELTTNAAKFGALSTPSGRASARWNLRRNEDAESLLCIDWEESGGPCVTPPSRSGFGTSVVRELVPYELGGTADLMHLPEGVCCKLEIPAHWLSSGNGQETLKSTN